MFAQGIQTNRYTRTEGITIEKNQLISNMNNGNYFYQPYALSKMLTQQLGRVRRVLVWREELCIYWGEGGGHLFRYFLFAHVFECCYNI